jgi:hypothetical protein
MPFRWRRTGTNPILARTSLGRRIRDRSSPWRLRVRLEWICRSVISVRPGAPAETTERYLESRQRLVHAVNDRLGIEPECGSS